MPAVRRYAVTAGIFGVAYVAFSLTVAADVLHRFDLAVASSFNTIYVPALLPVFRFIALLGGIELTGLLGLGLFIYLWRLGYRLGAVAAAALPLSSLVELVYKHTIYHPAPASLAHPDGPSFATLLEKVGGPEWSFPSGHMTRALVIYGLLAFVVVRLSNRPLLCRLALPVALGIVVLEAFDRLYLEVHWESDVIGGFLLGATFLAAAISWLEWSEARTVE
ncbi:MAG: phosphatase PAP2 family protein [Candidatus Dormibacteraeota bacterium]|nr:phosphatase PAP2 family protein [Candidatus Dormibacteraeota bacterium]